MSKKIFPSDRERRENSRLQRIEFQSFFHIRIDYVRVTRRRNAVAWHFWHICLKNEANKQRQDVDNATRKGIRNCYTEHDRFRCTVRRWIRVLFLSLSFSLSKWRNTFVILRTIMRQESTVRGSTGTLRNDCARVSLFTVCPHEHRPGKRSINMPRSLGRARFGHRE